MSRHHSGNVTVWSDPISDTVLTMDGHATARCMVNGHGVDRLHHARLAEWNGAHRLSELAAPPRGARQVANKIE